jgi:D-alanine-D-alanine ligase
MRIGVLFGGKSGEHEVSLRSAESVMAAIDPNKHVVVPICIDKEGLWERRSFIEACSTLLKNLDVVFPVLHGPFGEDGTIQGMLDIAGIPYVGASVLGSCIGLDKDVTKRLLRDAGISVADFLVYRKKPDFNEVEERLGLPFFVKPATMGSSVGITRVESLHEFDAAIELAFSCDAKIVIEEQIVGKELECAVLGLDQLVASRVGEVVPKGGVYTYERKYLDPEGAQFILPAQISPKKEKEIQEMALQVFEILCCDSMARVDFFMDKDETLYLNELNTIPGFTNISLYPKLFEISGISYPDLIERLINIACEKAIRKNLLSASL